jgi:hypothetical protein
MGKNKVREGWVVEEGKLCYSEVMSEDNSNKIMSFDELAAEREAGYVPGEEVSTEKNTRIAVKTHDFFAGLKPEEQDKYHQQLEKMEESGKGLEDALAWCEMVNDLDHDQLDPGLLDKIWKQGVNPNLTGEKLKGAIEVTKGLFGKKEAVQAVENALVSTRDRVDGNEIRDKSNQKSGGISSNEMPTIQYSPEHVRQLQMGYGFDTRQHVSANGGVGVKSVEEKPYVESQLNQVGLGNNVVLEKDLPWGQQEMHHINMAELKERVEKIQAQVDELCDKYIKPEEGKHDFINLFNQINDWDTLKIVLENNQISKELPEVKSVLDKINRGEAGINSITRQYGLRNAVARSMVFRETNDAKVLVDKLVPYLRTGPVEGENFPGWLADLLMTTDSKKLERAINFASQIPAGDKGVPVQASEWEKRLNMFRNNPDTMRSRLIDHIRWDNVGVPVWSKELQAT